MIYERSLKRILNLELVSLGALGNLNGFKVDRARLEI